MESERSTNRQRQAGQEIAANARHQTRRTTLTTETANNDCAQI
jgi:hypothetical protein